MRQVSEIPYAEMDPLMRLLVAYEYNGAMDNVCPMKDLVRIVEETPVVRWDMGVGFFSMADIVAVGNHPSVVSTNPATGEGAGMGSADPLIPLHIDGDLHRRYRKLIDPLFAPKQVALLEDRFRAMADRLIDGFIADGNVELFDAFAVPLPAQLFMTLFGAPLSDLDFFITKKDEILASPGVTREAREAYGRIAGDEMRARLMELLVEKRAAGATGDDLISQFLRWEVDGERLTDQDILNVMQLFVIAGLDTVTSSISCLIGWLAQHPEERRRVMDDPSLIPAVVEELMRYESPVPSSGARFAIDDFDINGVEVRKGDMIYLCWATANLDPAVFDEPLDVNFERASNRHIAFAAGRHRCLGSHLARLEIRLALEQFHRRVSDYWITEGEEPGYKFEGVRHASYLPVSFTAR